MALMFTSKISFARRFSASRFRRTWRNFVSVDETSFSAENQFFNWWRLHPQIWFTSNHVPFLARWCAFLSFTRFFVVLLRRFFLKMLTFKNSSCCRLTMYIRMKVLAFYVRYKCGICMLLDLHAIFLNITELLKLTLNVSVNLLRPQCRGLCQNNCSTRNTGKTAPGQIA